MLRSLWSWQRFNLELYFLFFLFFRLIFIWRRPTQMMIFQNSRVLYSKGYPCKFFMGTKFAKKTKLALNFEKNGLGSLTTNLLMAFTTGEAGSVNAVSGDTAFSVILALFGSISKSSVDKRIGTNKLPNTLKKGTLPFPSLAFSLNMLGKRFRQRVIFSPLCRLSP